MNILDYYVTSQANKDWYTKFQSTSNKKSGKTFSYINTNFRELSSFLTQFRAFRDKLGKERKDWNDTLPCGQETDKHRIANLLNSGFITQENNVFRITAKGLVLSDLIDAIEENNYNDSIVWCLLFPLLMDYRTEERDFDIFKTTKEYFLALTSVGYSKVEIINMLKKGLNCNKKEILFSSDIFWLTSFYRDKNFIDLYHKSTAFEKEKLKEYLLRENLNKKTKDCIAHKFTSGGAYQTSTFREDLRMLYFVNYVMDSGYFKQEFFDDYISECKLNFIASDVSELSKFITNHKSVYMKIYKKIKMGGF